MLNLVWPWLLLILPLPWFVHRYMPRAPELEAALFVPFFETMLAFDQQQARGPRRALLRKLLLLLVWVLLVLAASRPQLVGEPVALPASGRDLMLAVDISGSMAQEDMLLDNNQVSRIILVKKVVNEFIERRPGDRIGLLLFGTESYIHVPLTFDRQAVKTLFNEAQLGFAGEQTSIGDAIGLAVKRLLDRPAAGRVLILLTDGRNTAGNVEPLQAAKLAAETGVTIYAVGIGADEITIRTFFGNQRFNPSADLDEDTLQEMARLTGGKYFRARNQDELEDIYKTIEQLEPVEQEQEIFRPVKALYYWPLAAAFATSLLIVLLHLPVLINRSPGEER